MLTFLDAAGDEVTLTLTVNGVTTSHTFKLAASPAEPSDPSEPTEPVQPSEPNEPTEPVEPSDPSEPSKPAQPAEPTRPGKCQVKGDDSEGCAGKKPRPMLPRTGV